MALSRIYHISDILPETIKNLSQSLYLPQPPPLRAFPHSPGLSLRLPGVKSSDKQGRMFYHPLPGVAVRPLVVAPEGI